ncbi:hypothetical protein D3C84_967590 [compost metagenome]
MVGAFRHRTVREIRTGQQVAEELVGAAHLLRVHRHIRFDIGENGVVVDEVQMDPRGIDLEDFSRVVDLSKNSKFDLLNVEVSALKRQVSDALELFQKG